MSTPALAAKMVVLQQPVDLQIFGKTNVAQEVRGAVPERDCLPSIVRPKKPGKEAPKSAGRARPAGGTSTTLNRLSHDRPIRFLRPRRPYVSELNLPWTLRPFKPILRGRA